MSHHLHTMAHMFCLALTRRCINTNSVKTNFHRRGTATQSVLSNLTLPAPHEGPTRQLPSVSSVREGDFFNLKSLFSLEDLLESRVHLGHKDGMLNPHMRPYIFGKRLGVLIFDLELTSRLLQRALTVTAEIAYRKGIILFVHQSRQNGHLVEAAAKECGEYAYCRRWNGRILSESEKTFGAVTRLPDLIVMFSVLEKVNELHKAVKMSAKMLIPTVGICDTNAEPTLVTYPVPGNDDSPQAIELYSILFKKAVLNGKRKREEIIKEYGIGFYHETISE